MSKYYMISMTERDDLPHYYTGIHSDGTVLGEKEYDHEEVVKFPTKAEAEFTLVEVKRIDMEDDDIHFDDWTYEVIEVDDDSMGSE